MRLDQEHRITLYHPLEVLLLECCLRNNEKAGQSAGRSASLCRLYRFDCRDMHTVQESGAYCTLV